MSNETILLTFNIDGLPLYKSSNDQVWPILCYVEKEKVFTVSLFVGKSKPYPLEDFLDLFIQELTSLNENGIELNGQHRNIVTRAFICDSPARSFLKCVQNHTGYNACERLAVS